MKSILIYTSVVAAGCSALFVSIAVAGGHHGVGVSRSATSTSSAITATGRSPLREPVFLIPSSSSNTGTSTSSGGPSRGANVVFSPPPTIVGQGSQAGNATANPAGNNFADRAFGQSILNTGLRRSPTPGSSQNNHWDEMVKFRRVLSEFVD